MLYLFAVITAVEKILCFFFFLFKSLHTISGRLFNFVRMIIICEIKISKFDILVLKNVLFLFVFRQFLQHHSYECRIFRISCTSLSDTFDILLKHRCLRAVKPQTPSFHFRHSPSSSSLLMASFKTGPFICKFLSL